MSNLGILDWPGVLFGLVNDLLLFVLPLPLTLVFWAAVSGWATMWVYRATSNQEKLAALKPQVKAVQEKLKRYDGEFSGLIPLIRENFRLSGRHIGLAIGPALIAGIPVLFVLVWGSNEFGAHFPEAGARVNVEVSSDSVERDAENWRWTGTDARQLPSAVDEPLRWRLSWPDQTAALETATGEPAVELPPEVPTPMLHKRKWWNLLIGNPAGYLASDNPVDSIRMGLPSHEILPVGPGWMRGWLFTYFVVLIAVSLGFKFYWKVH
ncbi:hypothetical protein [Wenzhouxiangella sediminis]|uniref:DUF106 domain-containing protein n=1 Tax=Wenzhouxiangella sediminis TaxID=1792836 RepID=A0A3E1K546_9GAMM|nr:hypothetical protein [Wenzhouxiangella sediminis]RFF29182.1 hypothetical protein DZC52_13820 [Wenzhouxiangella sediminis]